MSKVFLLGANVEIDTEIKTVGIGQIIRMEGYEYDNYVVADITHDSYGYSYRLINLRTYEYVTAETIRPLSQKFGIGFYYDDTAPQFFGTDELRAVIHKAEKIADAEIRRKEQEREERQRTKQRGMELLRRIVPADVRAVIIAELHEDDSDPMTDYYGYRNIRTVILGFSHKTRVDFAEMRRAAAHFPDTAYLAEYNREYEHRENTVWGTGTGSVKTITAVGLFVKRSVQMPKASSTATHTPPDAKGESMCRKYRKRQCRNTCPQMPTHKT